MSRKIWEDLHAKGYFDNHPYYRNRDKAESRDLDFIKRVHSLGPSDVVMIIGAGYGRETLLIAPFVKHVYCVDYSKYLIDEYLEGKVDNYTVIDPESSLPSVDFIYSLVTFQHMERELVRRYIRKIGLNKNGRALIQFLEVDKEKDVFEPCYSWNRNEIFNLIQGSGYIMFDFLSETVKPNAIWHWAYFGRL